MRNQWRFLLRFSSPSVTLSSTGITTSRPIAQVTPSLSLSYFSSLLHSSTNSDPPQPASRFINETSRRYFSSESMTNARPKSPELLTVIEVFSKPNSNDEIKLELDSKIIVITHDLVLNVLKELNSSPDTAIKFFDWVLERDSKRLSSKCYNFLLGTLGSHGPVEKFWALVESMKQKGYGVHKGAYDKALKKFEEDGMQSDLEKLKRLYLKDNDDDSVSDRLIKIIKAKVWDEDVEKSIQQLNVRFSSGLIRSVIQSLSSEPMKAFIFFRWVDESGFFKHDQQTYNAMLSVLDRKDCVERFWSIVHEIKKADYQIERGVYFKALHQFIDLKLIKDSVDLYDFCMRSESKPSASDLTYLLKKTVIAKEFDIELFKKVVKVFREEYRSEVGENAVDAVMKSLISVGRIPDCNKVLDVLLESGLKPTDSLKSKIAFMLSSLGRKDEARVFTENLEAFDCGIDSKTLAALVQGHCVAGDLEKASDSFKKLVEKDNGSSLGSTLQLLVNTYCNRSRAVEVCKLVSELIKEKELKPEHDTYKSLIKSLLVQGGFNEALELIVLMKNDGFPPYVNPLIEYVSRHGTGDDAMRVLKAMTVRRFPSRPVFIDFFEAFFKCGRYREAQNFLAECPDHIKNSADVLDLFYTMKSQKASAAKDVNAKAETAKTDTAAVT